MFCNTEGENPLLTYMLSLVALEPKAIAPHTVVPVGCLMVPPGTLVRSQCSQPAVYVAAKVRGGETVVVVVVVCSL